MVSSKTFSSQILSFTALGRLRESLRHMIHSMGTGVVVSEDALAIANLPVIAGGELFTLVVSHSFSALLQATLIDPGQQPAPAITGGQPLQDSEYQVNLTFEPGAIATFLRHVLDRLSPTSDLYTILQQAYPSLQPNDPDAQGQFTLQLAAIVAATPSPTLAIPAVPIHPVWHDSAKTAILEPIDQERLLHKMMTQVRQSLDLPVILQTAVAQGQQLLQVDRLVIYQFDRRDRSPNSQTSLQLSESLAAAGLSLTHNQGFIAYEAIASQSVPSILNLTDNCQFFQRDDKHDLYRQGHTLAVENVDTYYAPIPCLLEFLKQAQVRAKLIAPILVHNQLWGLLIAHHCQNPRRWQDQEQKFLRQIAEHLAIAIGQAQLYTEVQRQKQTLEQRVLERTQELQDALLAAQGASRVKSEFLAAVSHELRTPLTCVIGMSTTLMRWANSALNDRQRKFLQTIHDSGEHLMELINDLLEMSQLEAGKAILNLEEFSLSYMAQQLIQSFQDKAAAGEINLSLDLQIAPPHDRFTADSRRVEQILFNLLSNAIKFTPAGGTVILRILATDMMTMFQVKDTGIGIPDQERSLLFQKFQQLDPSYHRQYNGIGLGLALTKQLVELHGGRIDVESTVGVGSVFTVHLPTRHPDSTPTFQPKASPFPGKTSGQIVLIENDEESAYIICDILNAAGYQLVWMLEEGSTAIPQIEILQPVAVITNTWLSNNHNYDIISSLRQNPLTQTIKILALIAINSFQDREHCLSVGADDYLTKPIRPEQVLQKISSLLG